MTQLTEEGAILHGLDTPLRASLVVTGVVLAAFMDAVASTALSIGRIDMLGDIYATPDELALADIVFIAARLTSFLIAPLLVMAAGPIACLRAGTVMLLLSSAAMTFSADLTWIYLCRVFQGIAGGAILVAGQTLLFLRFPQSRQPVVQAVFAIGAVMAPATVTPALQGWLVDHLTWDWIFLCNVPLGVASLALLAAGGDRTYWRKPHLPVVEIMLLGLATASLTYVLQQGSRFNWFDDVHITVLGAAGIAAAGVLVICEIRAGSERALRMVTPFASPDFRFGLLVSLVAGFALSGSAYLVPAFALSVLNFTATGAGALLLPSGAMLVLALLLAGLGIEKTGITPIMLVPFGILAFAGAMWLLSGSASASGPPDLILPLLLRGFGLGLLFVALTLVTLGGLPAHAIAFGVGLFNLGKQAGGLFGTAFLQTYIDHQTALNRTVLSSHLVSGDPALDQRLRATANLLASNGMDAAIATKAALPVLQRALDKQAATIAFTEAFFALVLLFAIAAPCLILAKRVIGGAAADKARRGASRGISDGRAFSRAATSHRFP
jgi:DHA2 family multidrug resistance protein